MAIKQSRFQLFNYILIETEVDPKLQDSEGKTALHHAVALLQKEMVQNLLNLCDYSSEDLNVLTHRNETPLMKCCRTIRGSAIPGEEEIGVQIAKLLIEKGADVNLNGNTAYDKYSRRTALHWAAAHDNIPMIKLLYKAKANIEATDVEVSFFNLFKFIKHI